MARLIEKKESLPNTKKAGRDNFIISIILVLSGGAALLTGKMWGIAVFGCALGLSVISLLIGIGKRGHEREIKRYGNMGERASGVVFSRQLPDSYTVIQNAVISYGGEQSETDNIIVGPTGVFIIETKNLKGEITGNTDERQWLQHKTDQYGIEHDKTFYSPVKQVGTHVFRLANYLRDNGVFTHVYSAVYFTNPEAFVRVIGDGKTPVFTVRETKSMLSYIKNGEGCLTEWQIQKIIDLIK